MQRKIDKRHVYNAGRCKADEELIHMHMCNHYRRILNAKKAVDNSPPYCYKAKRPATCKPSLTKPKGGRPFENLPLSDRSLSTNSNKSCWGAESLAGSSRYHARCIPQEATHIPSTKHDFKIMDLVDRIAFDTKRGPAVYCDEHWMGMKDPNSAEQRYEGGFEGQQNPTEGTKSSSNAKRRLQTSASQESAQKRKFAVQKKLKSSRLTAKGSKSFPSLDDKMYTKTFKTEAVSKLRSLRVYYPPRRKESRNKSESSSKGEIPQLESPSCKCTKICVCDSNETVLKKMTQNAKEQSLTSSRDSAYNGGVSSLPESRSPTPDQRKAKKECCCCCCEKKQPVVRIFDPSKPMLESPRPRARLKSPPPPLPTVRTRQQESFEKMQEDAMYVKFIQDITTEILDKNLYTNKALKKVMKKHIKFNTKKLHKDRMLKEVENLRIQLGIPEDKSLLDIEPEGESAPFDASKFYPIISDSEFVLPKNKMAAMEKTHSTTVKSSEKIPKSISGIIASNRGNEETVLGSETGVEDEDEDGGEVISVIQVTKTIREKRKEKSVEVPTGLGVGRNSSDDSDRPSDPKKRSLLKNRKQKYVRTYSSFSSDSESSGNLSRKLREKAAERRGSGSKGPFLDDLVEKASYLSKKNRSVSFWKSSGHDLIRNQKKTVAHGKDAVARDKPKND